MIKRKSYCQLLIVGACLVVIGGGALAVVLNSPPELYTYSANQIDGGDELSPSVVNTAANRKSTVTSIETVDEDERKKLESSIESDGDWTTIETTTTDSFEYKFVSHQDRLFEVKKKDDPAAIRLVEIQGEEKVEALSIDVSELSDRTYSGVRRTDTQYEVVRQTVERERYSSFTRVNVDDTIIDHRNEFYEITAESRQNSNGFMLWSFSVVFLSLALVSGILLLVYPIVSYVARSLE